ncbi:MAG: ATP cone domain-containing protein, partial [Candidatus Micrarchaeota archaeon]|nr:ATP cone domain-containing protein [Candidatus Micrarchaeota archaeon]
MVIRKIKKRDGRLADFDHRRITTAIFKAAKSLGGSDWAAAENVTDKAVAEL